jgi:hypothetical protein
VTDFDYAGWVSRAQAFVDRIAGLPDVELRSREVDPPLSREQIDGVAAAVGRPIPEALRRLLVEGASRVDCAYAYEPADETLTALQAVLPDETRIYGGARLCAAAELRECAQLAAEWANETWVADEADQQTLWEAALPFAALENGDYLALDTRGEAPDPPVLYLCHDDDSSLLAPSFSEFLARWERLCYLGPEHWLLDPFLGEDGTLDPQTERAARLRELFRDRPAPSS